MPRPSRATILATACLAVTGPVTGARADLDSCAWEGIPLNGDVEVVDSFPDMKVQIVDSFPDLRVEVVESFPDDCGQWRFVDSFPDFTVQFVDSFPDFTIEMVESYPGLD